MYLKTRIFIFLLIFFILPGFAQGEISNKITKIDLIQDENFSKVIIGLSSPLNHLPHTMATLETISFEIDAVYDLKKPKKANKNQYSIIQEGFLTKVGWYPDAHKTKFEIKRQYYSPLNLKNQDNPPALVIEFPRKYFNKESWELKPGIFKHLIRTVNERGPVVANILEVDLLREDISVKVGLANKENIKNKETLLNIVKNEMAYAGINTNYFDVKVGNPLGTLISDGMWVVGPLYDRVAFGFSKDKKVYIDQVRLISDVEVYRWFRRKPFLMLQIENFNLPLHLVKGIAFYNNTWDKEIILPEGKIALFVRNNTIKKIEKELIKIPEDGYVLVGGDDSDLSKIKKRYRLKLEWKATPDWTNVTEAVSGGPYLVMSGNVYVDDSNQKIKFAKKDTFAPRSAIGIGKNGNLYLIAVSGRNNGYSVGLTLKELAELLQKLYIQDAINLDGGGSTTLVAGNEILNNLSDHHERKISNGLLIFYKD